MKNVIVIGDSGSLGSYVADELFLRKVEFIRLAQLGELQDNQASSL